MAEQASKKRKEDPLEEEGEQQETPVGQSLEYVPVEMPGFTYDPNSGWFIQDENPSWQYNPFENIFYNAGDGHYYRMNEDTNDYEVVEYTPPVIHPIFDLGTEFSFDADLAHMQGRRPHQEDRHVLKKNLDDHFFTGTAGFFGIYDGHMGAEASEYVSKNLPKSIFTNLQPFKDDPQFVSDVLVSSFEKVDAEYLPVAKSRKRKDGCCAINVLILGSTLYTSWVGDSRAVLCSGDNAVRLSEDHKPNLEKEKARIEGVGGHVVQVGGVWRVANDAGLEWLKAKVKKGPPPVQLAVCRSFGDIDFKEPVPYLSATPDIHVHKLTPEDRFIILACDGVWDVMSDQEAVDIVLKKIEGTPKDGAGALVSASFQKGSTDNLSCIVIHLRHGHERPSQKNPE